MSSKLDLERKYRVDFLAEAYLYGDHEDQQRELRRCIRNNDLPANYSIEIIIKDYKRRLNKLMNYGVAMV